MAKPTEAEKAERIAKIKGLLHLPYADIAAITGLTLPVVSKAACRIRREAGQPSPRQQARVIEERVRQYLLSRPADTRQIAVAMALGISEDQARRAMLVVQPTLTDDSNAVEKRPCLVRRSMFYVDDDRLFSANRNPSEVTLSTCKKNDTLFADRKTQQK